MAGRQRQDVAADHHVIGERQVVRLFLAWFAVLNLLNAVAVAVPHLATRWLLLGLERNPSTWFSAALLATAGALAWAVGRDRADTEKWNLVAGLLVVLSLDEVATLHEKLAGLPFLAVGSRAWAGAGLVLVALTAWRLLPWALHLEAPLRFALLVGGTTFLTGAVGMEVLAGNWEEANGADRMFWVISSVEEDLELIGVFVVVRVLLAHLRGVGAHIRLGVGP